MCFNTKISLHSLKFFRDQTLTELFYTHVNKVNFREIQENKHIYVSKMMSQILFLFFIPQFFDRLVSYKSILKHVNIKNVIHLFKVGPDSASKCQNLLKFNRIVEKYCFIMFQNLKSLDQLEAQIYLTAKFRQNGIHRYTIYIFHHYLKIKYFKYQTVQVFQNLQNGR